MSITLAAFRSWVRYNLPVVAEWLAFCQSRNEYGDECDKQEDADSLEAKFVAPLPEPFRHSLEKLGDGELGHPDEEGIEYPGRKNELRTHLAVLYHDRVRQAISINIVGAPDEYDMHEAHSYHERNDAPCHDFVLAEELLITCPAASEADDNDEE